MDELRESSLLFSLEGLLETERERVQREAREAQKRRDEEMIRVAEQASRLRLAAEQERAARQRRAELEQERERLDAERIDAMKRAAIERARIETEAKVRLVEVEQARRHELHMSQLREGERTARYRVLAWISGAGCALSVAAALGVYFGYLAPAHAQQKRQLEAIVSANAEKTKATERALGAEQRKSETLSLRLQQLEAQIRERPPESATSANVPSTAIGVFSKITPPTKLPVLRNCPDDGDPLRGCLGGSGRNR